MQSAVAKPSDPAAPPPPGVEKDDNKKRKREELDESDPKLREYLQVFQPSKKSYANEMVDVMEAAAAKEQKKLLEDGESDDEYEAIPPRPEKRQMREAPKEDQRPAEPLPDKDEAMPDAAPIPGPTRDATQKEASPAAVNNAATSDDDWLRSRTNRLLDLMDDDEVLQPPAQQDSGETVRSTPAVNHEGPADDSEKPKPETDAGAGAEDAPAPSGKKAEKDEDETLATIKRTSRLFVRNLAYSVNEDDLRTHFEQFGELQEVSEQNLLFSYSAIQRYANM